MTVYLILLNSFLKEFANINKYFDNRNTDGNIILNKLVRIKIVLPHPSHHTVVKYFLIL